LGNEVSAIDALYRNILDRAPQQEELDEGVLALRAHGLEKVLQDLLASPERVRKVGAHPPGHYYSPLNDFGKIDYHKIFLDRSTLKEIPGVDVNLRGQRITWKSLVGELLGRRPKNQIYHRYSLPNGTYGEGDAVIQKGMMLSLSPRMIIEIGSGYSSASMLDCSEEYDLGVNFVFIEPFPSTLNGLLRPEDAPRVIKDFVQNVSLEIFDELGESDILFVDSSHVMKSQSDVNFELFEILPRLKSGVVVHFHDVFWPFEYPIDWMQSRGYSWNELYGLRAFLMYNHQFEIIFWNDAFPILCGDAVDAAPDAIKTPFLKNPGGGLWLRKK
jgi:hypothetical protein